MTFTLKKTIGGAVLTALVAGGLALTAVAPASAATVDKAVVKAAVQGDRIQGPFITRSAPPGTNVTNPMPWNNWNTDAGVPRYETKNAPNGQTVPPVFSQPTEIWSFPAVGTTGPIMNSQGQCLIFGAAIPGWPGRETVLLGSCDGAPSASVSAGGVIQLGGRYISDSAITGYSGRMITGPSNPLDQAETLYMPNMTPVAAADCTAGLTGSVSTVDQTAHSAVVSGTGAAGETITVSGSPSGPVTATVDASGNWTATVTGLSEGANSLNVTSSDNCAPVALSVTIDPLSLPIMHPVAAAAGVLGLGVLGLGVIRRRKTALL
jgi:hypothetical protein